MKLQRGLNTCWISWRVQRATATCCHSLPGTRSGSARSSSCARSNVAGTGLTRIARAAMHGRVQSGWRLGAEQRPRQLHFSHRADPRRALYQESQERPGSLRRILYKAKAHSIPAAPARKAITQTQIKYICLSRAVINIYISPMVCLHLLSRCGWSDMRR